MNQGLYQPVILKHSQNPYNSNKLKHYSHFAEGYNQVCGDHIEIYIDIDNGTVKDIGFVAQGCAIMKACASVMTLLVKNKNADDIEQLLTGIRKLWESEEETGLDTFSNDDMNALTHLQDYPSRWKCAILPWETLNAALAENKSVVTTE